MTYTFDVRMKRLFISSLLVVANVAASFADETSFWDELLNVAVAHIRRDGPDSDSARFITMAREPAWARRFEIFKVVTPYLADENPDKAGSAIEILYRFRSYRPMDGWGNFEAIFEADNASFFAELDNQIHLHVGHFWSLESDRVLRSLAFFLGVSPSPDAKHELLEIARRSTTVSAKEQALICLAWHRDPEDMETLLPFMLEDSQAARRLPYHFRNSYGDAALPYLQKALMEAKLEATRREAEKELRLVERQ